MRATHSDPRLLLAALATALVFALLAAGPTLDLNDLGLFPGGGTADVAPAAQPTGTPAWAEDPMASPLAELRQAP